MSNELIAQRVRELLAYHSGAAEGSLQTGSSAQNTDGWDSLANLNLMAALEDEYGLTLATRDVVKLRTLGDIISYVEANAAPGRTG